jgi:hypothetical protein
MFSTPERVNGCFGNEAISAGTFHFAYSDADPAKVQVSPAASELSGKYFLASTENRASE